MKSSHEIERLDYATQAREEAVTARLNGVLTRFQCTYPESGITDQFEQCLALSEADLVVELAAAGLAQTPRQRQVLGIALRMQGRPMDSLDILEELVAKGFEPARTDLGKTLLLLGRTEEAEQELLNLEWATLKGADLVHAYRFKADVYGALNCYYEALSWARRAKKLAQALPERKLVLPWCLLTLGIMAEQTGNGRLAIWYLRQALKLLPGDRRYAELNLARVLIDQHQLAEAALTLTSLGDTNLQGQALKTWLRLKGHLSWLQGSASDAQAFYSALLDLAEEACDPANALKALHGRVVVAMALDNQRLADASIARARQLASTPSMSALTAALRTLFNLRTASTTPEEAASQFAELRRLFAQRAERPDECILQLMCCEAARRRSPQHLEVELDGLRTLVSELGQKGMLTRFWPLFPELLTALSTGDLAAIGPPEARHLRLWTLGRAQLTVNDQEVKLGASQGVECLAYLLEFGPVPLELLLRDVYGEYPRAVGRNRFKQLRHRLEALQLGLRIAFGSGLYQLESVHPLWWDLRAHRLGSQEFRDADFLPSSGSEWVVQLNQSL